MSARLLWSGALLGALLLGTASPAQARFSWQGVRDFFEALGRGSGGWVREEMRRDQTPVFGYMKQSDQRIRVWRGPTVARTLTHELLHRATSKRPEAHEREMRALTGDMQIDEGLTTYFAERALEQLGQKVTAPATGAPFGERRAWARQLRRTAQTAIAQAYGVHVDVGQVSVLSDRPFGRVHLREADRPWVKPTGEQSYAPSVAYVRQLVELVGEGPLRKAYFEGDVAGLREALRQARARVPRSEFPDGIDLSR